MQNGVLSVLRPRSDLSEEHLGRSPAVRKFLAEGLEAWRRERALDWFVDGDLLLSAATGFTDCSAWEFAQPVEESDAAWVSKDHLEADIGEL